MSKLAKIIAGISFSLIVLLITLIILSYRFITKSHPQLEGTIKADVLIDTVFVYRDENGIAHIFARNERDLYFVLGYVTAQDRLWQMDFYRRLASGRLSEIFGIETLEIDQLFRTIGLYQTSKALQRYLSEKSISILSSYTDGVNYFIRMNKGNYSIEFKLLGYEPEEWSIADCLSIMRLIAWQLNFAWWSEPVFNEILEKVGEKKFKNLIPDYPKDAPLIVKKFSTSMGKFTDANIKYRKMFRIFLDGLGSNSWVISGKISKTGKPILANDPHLPYSVPSIWYQVHLNDGSIDVVGVCIPGTPGVVIGRNNYIAWGLTNVMLDDTDFYIEVLDSTGKKYLYDGEWFPISEREEIIKVKGKGEYKIKVLSTHRGPIVSNVYGFSFVGHEVDAKYVDSKAISMQWTGNIISDEVLAFYRINRARSWEEFKDALKSFAVPAQNFIYADIYGNIGYYCAGRIPIRKKLNPLLLNSGEVDDFDWIGFVQFSQQPNLFNPPSNYIATANNKVISDDYPYYISYLWEPESRAIRINEYLTSKKTFEIEDFKALQLDYFSYYAKEITPYIISAFEKVNVTNDLVKKGIEYLKTWNYVFTRDDIATTIFNSFIVTMMKNTFEDELGEDLYSRFMFYSGIPLRVLKQLIVTKDTLWFDDVRTDFKVETMDEIIRKSFEESIHSLRKHLGDDILSWHWGRLHKLELVHPIGSREPLNKIFNLGPFEIGGASTTVNNAGFSILKPFDCVVGASMRQIVDLSESSLYSIIPTGSSGQVMSQFYDNQLKLYIRGEYIRIETRREKIEEGKAKLLLFISGE